MFRGHRRYINFGALVLNYLVLAQNFARYTDPTGVDAYDSRMIMIEILMQVLTFGLFLSFAGVMIKKGVVKARSTNFAEMHDDMTRRIRHTLNRSSDKVPRLSGIEMHTNPLPGGGARAEKNEERQSSVEVRTADTALPAAPIKWETVRADDGKTYYHNRATGETSWTPP